MRRFYYADLWKVTNLISSRGLFSSILKSVLKDISKKKKKHIYAWCIYQSCRWCESEIAQDKLSVCHESLSHPLAGAGDCLVHRLPGPHLLLVPRLPGGEQVQQGVCDLRRRPVVGHGECGQENHPHLHQTSLACGSPLQTSLFFWWKKSNADKQQWAANQSEICRGSGQASLQWHSITCHHRCIIETGH